MKIAGIIKVLKYERGGVKVAVVTDPEKGLVGQNQFFIPNVSAEIENESPFEIEVLEVGRNKKAKK